MPDFLPDPQLASLTAAWLSARTGEYDKLVLCPECKGTGEDGEGECERCEGSGEVVKGASDERE